MVGERQMTEEVALKSTEGDDKLSEEEVQSMASGKSKSTTKSTAEDWFNHFNTDVQEYNKFTGYDGLCPYSLCFFFLLVKNSTASPSLEDWYFQLDYRNNKGKHLSDMSKGILTR